ncbi:hypothetical protein P0R31_31575 [Bradyrhizobium yuanmingense]|uniref:hypothetical protein n=1 Tax=Bradyrhizobium yuanmingense TaxID=108015 RepID=UPI0023BA01C7|nr:hypothetical protein [Bradyrhizobium yuanmingense]MDF0521791.1 hypothetical protein [Bradyrhizobium yuanmingense]
MLHFELSEVVLEDVYANLQNEMALVFRVPLKDQPGVYVEITERLKIVRDSPLQRFAEVVLRFEELNTNMSVDLADEIARRTGWKCQRVMRSGRLEFVFKTKRGITQLRRKEGAPLKGTDRRAIVAAETGVTERTVKSIINDGRRVGSAWVSMDERTAERLSLKLKPKR